MMRGTTEFTVQDAMRAAHTELRRAAREREREASAPWTMPSSSPSRGDSRFSRLLGDVGLPPRFYIPGMTTTIKVSDELRNRLKEQAARDGLTLGAHLVHLAHLADAEDTRWRLHLLKSEINAPSGADAGSYDAKAGDWERMLVLLDQLQRCPNGHRFFVAHIQNLTDEHGREARVG